MMNRYAPIACLTFLAAFLAGGVAEPKDKPDPKSNKVLRSAAKDIIVLSDKEETAPAFFQRQRIIVGGLDVKKLATLAGVKAAEKMVFLNYTSHNDDPAQMELFGDLLTVAPLDPAVDKLLKEELLKDKPPAFVNLVLRRESREVAVYHVVGYTTRTTVSFFARKKEGDFNPKVLWFVKE